MLRAMRKRVMTQPAVVLEDFFEECGIPEPLRPRDRYTPESLAAGLHFLEQAALFPLVPASAPTLFLHGNNDTVIPLDAGRYFSQIAGGSFEAFEGPHAFFAGREREPRQRIERFTTDLGL